MIRSRLCIFASVALLGACDQISATEFFDAHGAVPLDTDELSFVADRNTGEVYLAGGIDPVGERAETWRYQDGQYEDMRTSLPISAVRRNAMALDERTGKLYQFGGINEDVNGVRFVYATLLVLEGPQWVLLEADVDTPPVARYGASLMVDHTLDRLLLFGGFTVNDVYDPQLYQWSLTSTAPRWEVVAR